MKTLSILCFAVMAVLSAGAQIGAKGQQNKIQGVWQNNSFGYQMTLTLNADGTGEFDGEAIKYTAKDNRFTMIIVAESQTLIYNFNLQRNSLTVSGGDLEDPINFSRSSTSEEILGEKN